MGDDVHKEVVSASPGATCVVGVGIRGGVCGKPAVAALRVDGWPDIALCENHFRERNKKAAEGPLCEKDVGLADS